MVAILLNHGISATRISDKSGLSTIRVDDSQIADAVTILHAAHYPRTAFENMGEIFQQKGMISSPTAERARFLYALSQELSRTLSDIDGVLTARIHIVLPQNDPLAEGGKPSAAAVFIRYDNHVDIQKLLPQIKMLVANSIEGLSYNNVSVVMLPVATSSSPLPHKSSEWSLVTLLSILFALLIPGSAGGWWFWRRYKGKDSVTPAEMILPSSDVVTLQPKIRKIL